VLFFLLFASLPLVPFFPFINTFTSTFILILSFIHSSTISSPFIKTLLVARLCRRICTEILGTILVVHGRYLQLNIPFLDSNKCRILNTFCHDGYYKIDEDCIFVSVTVPMILFWRNKQGKKLTWTPTPALVFNLTSIFSRHKHSHHY
jgi:hypothetical protein